MPVSVRSKSTGRESDDRCRLLSEKWLDLRSRLRGLSRNPAPEVVHDIRVAVRSLRALLRSLRDETNPAAYAQLRFDLINFGRELATIRTADVRRRTLDKFLKNRAHPSANERATLQSLLAEDATVARLALARRRAEPRWSQRLKRIDAAMAGDELLLKPVRSVRDEYCAMLVAAIEASVHALHKCRTGTTDLHRQRIRIKSARYLCAMLASQMDTHRLQERLNKAQDILGDIHDLDALIRWIQCAAIPLALARRLVAQLRKRRAHLLEKFLDDRPVLLRDLHKAAAELRSYIQGDAG